MEVTTEAEASMVVVSTAVEALVADTLVEVPVALEVAEAPLVEAEAVEAFRQKYCIFSEKVI